MWISATNTTNINPNRSAASGEDLLVAVLSAAAIRAIPTR
jgi:hypothetical protein